MAARLGQNRGDPGVAASAEGQPVILHTDDPDHTGIWTSECHLIQIHVRPVCKIQLLAQLVRLLSFRLSPTIQTWVIRPVIAPRPITGKVFQQMFPHIFVLWSDQAEAKQKCAECECWVFGDFRFSHHGSALVDGLC